jgi:hypothetical protein
LEGGLQRAKIVGAQGSWSARATYDDGAQETLACVHKHYLKNTEYEDPWTPDLRQSQKFAEHVDLIRKRNRVILTTDDVDPSKLPGRGFFKRTGYVAVHAIGDFVLDQTSMRFRLIERVANAN